MYVTESKVKIISYFNQKSLKLFYGKIITMIKLHFIKIIDIYEYLYIYNLYYDIIL